MGQQNGTPAAPPSEDGMARALEEYLEAAEAGTAPPREEFLARYPGLAEQLDACLAALRFIGRAAVGPRSVAAAATAEPPEPTPGTLGDFRLIREVGRGGMGVVYEAEQLSLGRRVALKVLPFAATMDPRQLQRFHNEARAAASLDHPHIVAVHAVGCERGVHYYAMRFIEGQTLAALISDLRRAGGRPALPEAQPTTPHTPGQPEPAADTAPRAASSTARGPRDRAHFRRVAEWGIQAAEALDHAHQLGIVHRDVKPANLLVDGRGGLWVTDFGLAHVHSDARLTMTGDLVGTLRYMSPEQALAKRVVVDHRTDVYSLGATLYELLTLEPAFGGSDRQELLRQIAFEEPLPPRRRNKAVPAELETIVLKALEKNPADRYATAKELADDLRRWLADEPIRARPAGVVRRLRKWGRRHRAVVGAGAAALLASVLVLGGSIGWVAKDRDTRARLTADEVGKALEDSSRWQERRRVPEALAAARRARAALAGGSADAALRRRVQARVDDLDLLARLEEARLEASAGQDGRPDDALADRRFGEIFREFHLDVEAESAEQAAAAIASSGVAPELAALLDEWAELCRRLKPHDEARCQHLLAVARAADPDAWRARVRDALAREDREGLVRLASSEEATRLLPWTWTAVGQTLVRTQPTRSEGLLRKAQQRHPDDFWINFTLAEALSETAPAEERSSFWRVCVALRPQCPGAHNNLGIALMDKGRLDEAIAEYREALRLKKDFPQAHNNLGIALMDKGRLDEAIAEYREALRLKKDYASGHDNLGVALRKLGQLDQAIAEHQEALRLKRDYPLAHVNLGIALMDKGRLDEAIAEYRQAIGIKPDLAEGHHSLGHALHHKGRLEEAIAEYHEALRLGKDDGMIHNNLGTVLFDKGQKEDAIAEYREAIRLNKDSPDAYKTHYNLGNAVLAKGRLEEAIAEYREVIRLKKDCAEAHCNLGGVLLRQGWFRKAVEETRLGHELGSRNPRWPHPSAQWLRDAERLAALEGRLPKFLEGKEQPADLTERLALAQVCQLYKHLYAASARWYGTAFALQPNLADDPSTGYRHNAACAAALAGCGQGQDAGRLSDKERAGLRKQALDWLSADLRAWRTLLEKGPAQNRPAIAQQLAHWLEDTDLSGVRGPDALAKLPEAERQPWHTLWADVAATLALAQEKSKTPEKKAEAKAPTKG